MENEVLANQQNGVEIVSDGNPILVHNVIRDNGHSGVYVNENGRGTLEDNDIKWTSDLD